MESIPGKKFMTLPAWFAVQSANRRPQARWIPKDNGNVRSGHGDALESCKRIMQKACRLRPYLILSPAVMHIGLNDRIATTRLDVHHEP
jgi:hypothetical protein